MRKSMLGLLLSIVMLVNGLTFDIMAADVDLSAACTNYNVSFTVSGGSIVYATATPDGDNGILDLIVTDVTEKLTVTPVFTDNKAAIRGTNPETVTVDLIDGFAITEFEVVFEDSQIPCGRWTINAVDDGFGEKEPDALNFIANLEESGAWYNQGEKADSLTVAVEYTKTTEEPVTYQWYSNTQNSTEGGTPIIGATSASYIPSTQTMGITYYYVVASCEGTQAVSKVTQITVGDFPPLPVTDNVIDITDKTISSASDEYARLTIIRIMGADVEKAVENDTAVNIVLDADTPAGADITFEFGSELGFAEISGHTGAVTLNDKKTTQVVTIIAKSANISQWEESVTYTLNFSLGTPSKRKAERLEITKKPTKTNYIEGDSFDPSGMEVTVYYNDGTSAKTEHFEYAPSGSLTTKDTTITVTYKENEYDESSVSSTVAVTVEKKQSGGGGGGFYEEDEPQYDSINVYITFVNRGEIVVQNEEIEVFDENSDGKYCIGDAFLNFHRIYYSDGESGYKEISGNGLNGWVAKFWGRNDATLTYAHNYKWTKSTKDAIDEGDTIAVIIGTDEMFYSDLYTWFSKESYSARIGEDVKIKVNGLNLMGSNASHNAIYAPAGATVTVYDESGNEIEDISTTVSKDGTFTLKFTEKGTYTVEISGTAKWGSYNSAPVAPSTCIVNVSGSGGNYSGGDEELKGTASAPTTTADSSDDVKNSIGITDAIIRLQKNNASDWPQFLGDPNAQGLSFGDGATNGSSLQLRWEKNTGDSWCDVPGSPVVAGEYVYYYSSQYLRKVKLTTGEEVLKTQIYGTPVNQFFVNIAYGDGKIFVPCQSDNLEDGLDIKGAFLRVFDAETLKQLYVTESMGSGQMQSPVMYHNGYFVTGIYGRNAIYAAFTAKDDDPTRADEIKPISWKVDAVSKYGFSFNGAAFVGDMCYFGNGNILNIVNYKSGESSAFDIGEDYSIRSTITYSSETNRLYVASNHKDGYAAIFSYELETDGMPKSDSVCKWESKAEGGGTQAAPVIYKGRLYLGGGGHTMGSNEPFHVLDAVTLKEFYSVPILTKGSAAVCVAYANEENNHQVYIYMVPYAPNENESSELWIISDSQGQKEAKYEIAENIGRNQYCSQSLIVASDGALIWYNDGGYLYCYENSAGIFDDTKNHWAKENIAYMARRKIATGVGNNMFDPEGTITRAQFAQLLANMSGEDFSSLKTDAFSDVGSQWFAPAVAWAVNKKIADSDSNTYMPNEPITREDMALMLYRYTTNVAKVKLPVVNEIIEFADSKDIGENAFEAVALMQQSGIINGIADGNSIAFAPKNQASRAQASTMIARFCAALGR